MSMPFCFRQLQVWTKKLVLHNQELIMCLLTCIICVSLQSTVLWKLTWKDTRDTNDSSLPALQSSDNDDFNCSEDYNSDLDQGMGTYSKKYQKAQQNCQKYKSEMNKSNLKWNSLCGVFHHNPYVFQIKFGAKFLRIRYSPQSPLNVQHRKKFLVNLLSLTLVRTFLLPILAC